ncbi:MAG: DUF72 domain-containing protein [Chloroflexi bacterium]|nr:DUF72 domain-containing protein [Chloroflexota bacterium]
MASNGERPEIRIGTSGWVYQHWRSIFYPTELPSAKWLAFYADHFQTVELNASFYRLPSENAFRAWATSVPEGFIFAVKASRFVTHVKKLKDAGEAIENLLVRARLMGPKLGPILYQLPPGWNCNLERLADFLALLPTDLRYAFEFRNSTWLTEPVYETLERYGAALCIISLPEYPLILRATAPFVYIRLHGAQALYGSRYSDRELAWWAEQIAAFRDEGRDVYVYFNNDAFGYAVENAFTLRRVLGEGC